MELFINAVTLSLLLYDEWMAAGSRPLARHRHLGAVPRPVLDPLRQQLGLLHAADQRAHVPAPGAAPAHYRGECWPHTIK